MARTDPAPPPAPHACPRCGYNLSGAIAAWHPAGPQAEGACCPLRGTCSECGVEFNWASVMRPGSATPRWFVEAVHDPPDLRRHRLSVWKTLGRLALPWRFWKRVDIETPVMKGRIAWWLAWTTLGMMIVFLASAALLLWVGILTSPPANFWIPNPRTTAVAWSAIPPPPQFQAGLNLSLSERLDYAFAYFNSETLTRIHLWMKSRKLALACATGFTLVFALVFICLPITRARAKVRSALVYRTAAYSFAWLGLFLFLHVLLVIIYNLRMIAQLHGLIGQVAPAPWNAPQRSRIADLICLGSPFDLHGPFTYARISTENVWLLIILAWLLIYWWFALSRGLRMKEAPAVMLACGIPALLAAAVVWIAHPATMLLMM